MRTLLVTLTLALLTKAASAQEVMRTEPTADAPWVGHYVAEPQEYSEGPSQEGEILLYHDLTCTLKITIRWKDGTSGTIRSRDCSYIVRDDTVRIYADSDYDDARVTKPNLSVFVDKEFVMGNEWQSLSWTSPQPALVFERR